MGGRWGGGVHGCWWEEAYDRGFGERVYAETVHRASEVLASGRPVLIDGCFRARAQRAAAQDLAARFGTRFLFVEARITQKIQRARLTERAARDSVSVAAWTEIAEEMRATWEPAEEIAAEDYLALDTTRPLDQSADSIEARLPAWPPQLKG